MMRSLFLSAAVMTSADAFAASDVTISLTSPTGKFAYETGRYTALVRNIGNKSASSVRATIALPRTNTSPQVYVLGTLGARSAQCAPSGTNLVCNLGTVNKGASVSLFFDFAVPVNAQPVSFTASVSTTSTENSTGNNGASTTPSLLYYAPPLLFGSTWNVDHCTGTALTSFYECTLFAGAISSHEQVFNGDGSITFPGEPDYGGSWTLIGTDRLQMTYTNFGVPVATFDGRGASAGCWEGITTFPGSTYVAPYELCPL